MTTANCGLRIGFSNFERLKIDLLTQAATDVALIGHLDEGEVSPEKSAASLGGSLSQLLPEQSTLVFRHDAFGYYTISSPYKLQLVAWFVRLLAEVRASTLAI